jgi:predicted ABC-type sugar transport system permease subunit
VRRLITVLLVLSALIALGLSLLNPDSGLTRLAQITALVLLGIFILGTVNHGMTLIGLSSFWQEVARGVILIAAVAFDQLGVRIGGK